MHPIPGARERAVLAERTRRLGRDHPDTVAAREAFRMARAEAAVRAIVDQAPPLTDAQRITLANLLRPAPAVSEPLALSGAA